MRWVILFLLLILPFIFACGEEPTSPYILPAIENYRIQNVHCSEGVVEIDRITQWVSPHTGDWIHWRSKGLTSLREEKLVEAAQCLEQSLKGRPFQARTHVNLANTYFRLKNKKVAQRHLHIGIRYLYHFETLHFTTDGIIKRLKLGSLVPDTFSDKRALKEFVQWARRTDCRLYSKNWIVSEVRKRFGTPLWTRRPVWNRYRVWVAVKNKLPVLFDEKKQVFSVALDESVPKPIHVNDVRFSRGIAWIETNRGMYAFSERTEQLYRVVHKGNVIRSLIPKGDEFLQFYDDIGQWSLNQDDGSIKTVENRSEEKKAEWLKRGEQNKEFLSKLDDQWPNRSADEIKGLLQIRLDLLDYLIANKFGGKKKNIEAWLKEKPLPEMFGPNKKLQKQLMDEIAVACGGHEKAAGAPFQGITFTMWTPREYASPKAEEILKRIKFLGSDWVSITPVWFMEDIWSTEIHADISKSADLASVEHVIQKAHELGLKVLLKPHINLVMEEKNPRYWRGLIQIPKEDLPAWFKSYRQFIGEFFDIAVRQNVEIFSVGTELTKMALNENAEDYWKILIMELKGNEKFKGKLTYASLHEAYQKIPFWEHLDFVGVDAYFYLTKDYKAHLKKMIGVNTDKQTTGIHRIIHELKKIHEKTGKKIIFTEWGFSNADGSNYRPWLWVDKESGKRDNVEQAEAYQVFMRELQSVDFVEGMFNWEIFTHHVSPGDISYSMKGKLAELMFQVYVK